MAKYEPLAQQVLDLSDAKGIQGNMRGFASRLLSGARGAAFQAERTLKHANELVGIETRENFGELGGGYLDIVLTGNRVVDAKDWTGWANKTVEQKAGMLDHLGGQARKYLSKDGYTLKFEFKGKISDDLRKFLDRLVADYEGKLDWEDGL